MKPTLLILAAGMGSRYGGLKQIDPVGPNDEIIIDYSIYDAIQAGFGKLVFIIRHYFEDAFKEKIGSKFDGIVDVAYGFQELDACLDTCIKGFELPANRQKPWGTGHAILVGAEAINEPFAVINADDYYGTESFKMMAEFLSRAQPDNAYSMIGYILRNTLSEFGHVARGVCHCTDDMLLDTIVETLGIEKDGTGATYPDENGARLSLTGDEVVSMNLWGFQPSIFGHLKTQFAQFLTDHADDPKAEFYIPSAVDRLIQQREATVKVLPTHDTWFGVTYKQDHEPAVANIRRLIDTGVYPERLWG